MKIINREKLDDALKPSAARPIKATQDPNKRLRRRARSANKPEGKLATPAMNVRADAKRPACARLSPNVVVMIGKITTTTALKKCSVICAVELAAKRPQLANGRVSVVAI